MYDLSPSLSLHIYIYIYIYIGFAQRVAGGGPLRKQEHRGAALVIIIIKRGKRAQRGLLSGHPRPRPRRESRLRVGMSSAMILYTVYSQYGHFMHSVFSYLRFQGLSFERKQACD